MACPECDSDNVRRTQPGAIYDDYVCRKCGHSFTRLSPTAKRGLIVGGITCLTGGLDLGILGGLVSSIVDLE
jgi:transposase-like protein